MTTPSEPAITRRTLIILASLVFITWIGLGLLPLVIVQFDEKQSGPIGDTFGAVNSLFTALAFFGVVLTIFLQRQELALQRQELELTRSELRGSKEAQEKQAGILSSTAELNAIIALTTNAAKSLEHAITVGASNQQREEIARDYDSLIVRLRGFVHEVTSNQGSGFGFLSIEQLRKNRSIIEVSADPIAFAGTTQRNDGHRSRFRVRLTITNRSNKIVTPRTVEAILGRNGETFVVRFTDSFVSINPEDGVFSMVQETRDFLGDGKDVPTLGLVIITTVQHAEAFRTVFDESIAIQWEKERAEVQPSLPPIMGRH